MCIPSQQPTTAPPANVRTNRWTWSLRTTPNSIHVESDGPLPSEMEEEERVFHAHFARHVSAMVRKLSERFPYRHLTHWSMHNNDRSQHALEIEVKAPSTTN